MCSVLHLSHSNSSFICYHPTRAKCKGMAWVISRRDLIALDTQGKSTLIVRKGEKQEDLDFKERPLKLKLQISGKEHWHALFSAMYHRVSILGSPNAQLLYVTAQCLEETYQSLWDDTHSLLCLKLVSLFIVMRTGRFWAGCILVAQNCQLPKAVLSALDRPWGLEELVQKLNMKLRWWHQHRRRKVGRS